MDAVPCGGSSAAQTGVPAHSQSSVWVTGGCHALVAAILHASLLSTTFRSSVLWKWDILQVFFVHLL